NTDTETVLKTIKNQMEKILEPCNQHLVIPENIKPFVILLIGVNGSGKTTTIGKLAKKLQNDNYKIMLAAGDTFRAAAIDQLKIWGERNEVPVIAQKPGSDSAAVIYDAFQAAKSRDIDVLIADTAGRLHTHHGFMEELKKVKKILQKIDPSSPHEVLLVLDATIGQNAINQVKQFNEIIGITGICITKLDGSAKAGAIFAIAKETKIPIRFIGVGESIDDLKPFDAKKFVDALFGNDYDA
ncbi:MAG: signal recognition particle-docking protein FtsY, partial [Gammaproteobacteria bacterium]|nr:signal recognition particle-docking protein FtsY [Gammaproteobacteria bacterium]